MDEWTVWVENETNVGNCNSIKCDIYGLSSRGIEVTFNACKTISYRMGVRCYVMWILIIHPSFSSTNVYVMDCRYIFFIVNSIYRYIVALSMFAFVLNFNIQIPNHA